MNLLLGLWNWKNAHSFSNKRGTPNQAKTTKMTSGRSTNPLFLSLHSKIPFVSLSRILVLARHRDRSSNITELIAGFRYDNRFKITTLVIDFSSAFSRLSRFGFSVIPLIIWRWSSGFCPFIKTDFRLCHNQMVYIRSIQSGAHWPIFSRSNESIAYPFVLIANPTSTLF